VDLVENPAAFLQTGPMFIALTPDMEEGECGTLGMQLLPGQPFTLEYGIITANERPVTLSSPVRFAYSLCLDARAMPFFGYQQIVRSLGSRGTLWMGESSHGVCGDHHITALSYPTTPPDWIPFQREGSPVEIAELCQYYLYQAQAGDWHALEDGLRWLDRLCLHQHTIEMPGGQPLGAIGSGAAWDQVAIWLPELLFQAFRLTGIVEYASRGVAALSALQIPMTSAALENLYPQSTEGM
jgi:hypothetical protein